MLGYSIGQQTAMLFAAVAQWLLGVAVALFALSAALAVRRRLPAMLRAAVAPLRPAHRAFLAVLFVASALLGVPKGNQHNSPPVPLAGGPAAVPVATGAGVPAAADAGLAFSSIGVASSTNVALALGAVWGEALFDRTASRDLHLFAAESLVPSNWLWLGSFPMPPGVTSHVFAVSGETVFPAAAAILTNPPPSALFLRLGTDIDSDGDGLTDAFERLVSRTSPSAPDTDRDGASDGAENAAGCDPLARDTDGDGLVDGSDPDPLAATPPDDLDGDGIPDAYEAFRLGGTNAVDSLDADASGAGFPVATCLYAGLDPNAAAEDFAPVTPSLAAMPLAAPFLAEFPSGFTNAVVWRRTVRLKPDCGLRQYFVSGSPESGTAPDFGNLAFEWRDASGNGGILTPTSQGAIRLPVDNDGECDVTFTLRRSGAAADLPSRLWMLAYAPKAVFSFGATASTNGVTYLVHDITDDGPVLVDFDFSDAPDGGASAGSFLAAVCSLFASYGIPAETDGATPGAGLLTVSLDLTRPGIYPLPGPLADDVAVSARGVGGDDGGEAYSTAILAISPSIEWSGDHDRNFGGDALAFDGETGEYSEESEYPLDSGCIWREWWRTGPEGAFDCECVAEVDIGIDPAPSWIVTRVEDVEGGANGSVMVGGETVWEDFSPHSRHHVYDESGHGRELLSGPDDECGGCGDCESGDCDALEGASLGSLQFRIPLGSPRRGRIDAFLWFRINASFALESDDFNVTARSDASVSDAMLPGRRRVVRSNGARGRQVSIAPAPNRVFLTITNLFEGAGGKLDHTWEITSRGETMRLRKVSRAGNLMSDETYILHGREGTTVTNNVTGRVESVARSGAFTRDPESEVVETRTVFDASGAVFSHTTTTYRRFGRWQNAVKREVARVETTPWGEAASYATYWDDGSPQLVWGDARPWRYTAYDGRRRQVLEVRQWDDSECPVAWFLENLPTNVASIPSSVPCAVTETSYAPLPADADDPRDRGEPRCVSAFAPSAGGSLVLVSREWRVHTRGFAGGRATRTVETIRAASQSSGSDDPANAVSVATLYDEDAPGIPLVLRGRPLLERGEDGVVTRHVYTPCAFLLPEGVPAVGDGGTHWLCVSTEEFGGGTRPVARVSVVDAEFGLEVYSAERHVASGIDFGWEVRLYDERNRRVATLFADGSSSTNAYSCCRLLWTRGRDGAKTLRSATTGTDMLYHAEEEVSLAQLPHDDRLAPYSPFYNSDTNAYRVTQRFFDAFGRETNTTVRTCKSPGAAVARDWNCAGWRSSSSVAYPLGPSECRVATDARGVVTTTVRANTNGCETVTTSTAADAGGSPALRRTVVTTRPNGDTERLEIESGHDAGMSVATQSILRSSFSIFNSDGTRVDYSVTSTSDGDCVTNSIVRHDFLGRAIREIRPTSDVSYAYEGASSHVLSTFDSASGLAVTNLYDALGEQIGQIQCGVETRSETTYEVVSNVLWRSVQQTISTPNSSTPPLANSSASILHSERLSGLSPALRSETETFVDGVWHSRTASSFNPATLVLTETTVSATSGTNTVRRKFGRVVSTVGPAGTTQNYFDPFGRVFHTKRDGLRASWTGRDDFGDVVEEDVFRSYLTTSGTLHGHDRFGNRVATTNALGDAVHFAYDARNRLVATWGATYPLLHGHDAHGRRTSLSTTRDQLTTSQLATGQLASIPWDITEWRYDSATGLATNKTYADGSSVSYTYTPDGLSLRTAYLSGRWRENAYDANRRLTFCRSASPGGAGLQPAETNDVFFAYDAFGQTIAESNAVASAAYRRDRRGNCTNETAIVAGGAPSSVPVATNGIDRVFDAYGRLVRSGGTHYAYAPDGQISSISNAEAVVEYAYTSDRLDAGYTLTLANGAVFTRMLQRDAYRRSLVTRVVSKANGETIENIAYTYDALGRPVTRNADAFGYNDRGEVISTTISGIPSLYGYDGIGNSTNWSANCLNQYTADVATTSPSSPFSYDPDGNLLTNGVFSYAYDAENRLASVSSNGTVLAAFAYDAQGRRVRKVTPSATHTYFYDGWLLVRETLVTNHYPLATIDYVWGKDLSGTLQGSGGVGGLLYVSIDGNIYVPTYDYNGNVTHYLDPNGTIVAAYIYDAFGNIVSQSGLFADSFPHRFSTKYIDTGTGLYYYGYRFYSPELMRWTNRDPIEEQGGENLYAFCGNNAINRWDKLGNEFGITYVQFDDFLGHAWIRLGSEQTYDITELFEETLTFDGVNYEVKSATATLPDGIGFYPQDVISKKGSLSLYDGQWKYEVEKELIASRINSLKEFDTELKDSKHLGLFKSKLEYGESKEKCCKNATNGEIVSCLNDYAAQHPRQTYWLPFLNCRARAKSALSSCCLKVGKRLPVTKYGSIKIAVNPIGGNK